MENKRMSELPAATTIEDDDYTIIVQDGINKRISRGIFKQKDYNNLNNRPYINSTYSASQNPVNEVMQGTIKFHKISKTGRYSDLLDLPFIPTALTHLTNDGYFVQDQYYTHTDNNFSNGMLNKVNSAIQGIKVNTILLNPNENQEIDIVVPTKLSELSNDGYFVQDENYNHTDNNFTNELKNNYDNLVMNVNQPVSNNNKLVTMNDITAMDGGYWIPIDVYIDTIFDGVVNLGETIPTTGIYAVLKEDEAITISKYTNGTSDNANIPIREGYFIFVSESGSDSIYYIKEDSWKKLGGGSSGGGTEYDIVTTSKDGLMSSAMLTKLNGIAEGADNVTFTQTLTSGTKIGSLNINGTSKNIYAPASSSQDMQLHIGDLSGNTDSYTSNDNTAIFLKEGSTIKNLMKIEGSGGTTVGSNPLGTLYISSPRAKEDLYYVECITYWSSYSDGTNLTTTTGFTIDDFNKLTPGTVVMYEDANSTTVTYYGMILFTRSGYPYKSGGGRYFYEVIFMLDTNGNIRQYAFCCDAFGDESVYKGTTLP